MTTPLLLIAGIPATGKSHFAEWLKCNKGFVYLDVDKDPFMRSAGLQEEWDTCIRNRDALQFVVALEQWPQPVILEWGFPTQFLPSVAALKEMGFSIWWFNGDFKRAREAFRQRGTVDMAAFESQIESIERDWESIRATFAPNIITTLNARGRRLSSKEIYRRMKTKTS